jgi:chromosome segregation ATPase
VLALLLGKKMAEAEGKIDGAPNWVNEFLQRVEDRDLVRDEKENAVHKRILDSIGELASNIGVLGSDVGRIDRKLELVRQEVVSARRTLSDHDVRLGHLEQEFSSVHTEIDALLKKQANLEAEIGKLRNAEREASST